MSATPTVDCSRQESRLKYLAHFEAGQSITSESIHQQGDYPVYGGNGLRGFTDAHTHDGDFVLLGRQGALCGNINYAHGRFWASEHAVIVKPALGIAVRWLGELLRAKNLRQYSMSAAQPGLSVEFVENLPVSVPPIETQHRIADYLDSETAEIDALIAEKERMLALLEEQRAAVVTHAATRGLDPNVPLKPSGLEWLGEIPRHWRVERLKFHFLQRLEQGWSPQCDNRPAEEEEWAVLKVGCVNGHQFDTKEQKALPLDVEAEIRYEIKKGDILLSRGNTLDLVGSASLAWISTEPLRPNKVGPRGGVC